MAHVHTARLAKPPSSRVGIYIALFSIASVLVALAVGALWIRARDRKCL